MRVLLDESIPRRLKSELVGHEVSTVTEQGWRSKDNGELLAVASPVFDVLITADQRLEYQQNLTRYDLGIIVLVAYKNRLGNYSPNPLVRGQVAAVSDVGSARAESGSRGPGGCGWLGPV